MRHELTDQSLIDSWIRLSIVTVLSHNILIDVD